MIDAFIWILLNGCSCQYYAKGDAWHLPDGAYETIALLKDAGGHIPKVFSIASADGIYCFQFFSCYFFISNMITCDTVKVAVVSNFDTRLRKLLKDLNVLDLWVLAHPSTIYQD